MSEDDFDMNIIKEMYPNLVVIGSNKPIKIQLNEIECNRLILQFGEAKVNGK